MKKEIKKIYIDFDKKRTIFDEYKRITNAQLSIYAKELYNNLDTIIYKWMEKFPFIEMVAICFKEGIDEYNYYINYQEVKSYKKDKNAKAIKELNKLLNVDIDHRTWQLINIGQYMYNIFHKNGKRTLFKWAPNEEQFNKKDETIFKKLEFTTYEKVLFREKRINSILE